MRIKKRYIIMVVCWVIFIIVALYFNNRGENKYNFSYMNQAALIIDSNYDGKIELITPNPELSGSEKTEKKKVVANTYVYCSADSSSSYCGELIKGDEVLVYSSADGWFKISYNGRVAYVLSAAIEVPEEPTTPKPTQKPTQPTTTQPQPTTPAPTTPTTPIEPTQPSEEPSTPEEGTTGEGETPTGGNENPTVPEETPSVPEETPSVPEETTPDGGGETPTEPSGEIPSESESDNPGGDDEQEPVNDISEESFE